MKANTTLKSSKEEQRNSKDTSHRRSREIQLTQAYESNKIIFLKSEDEEYSSFGQTFLFSTSSPSSSSYTLASFEHEHQPQALFQSLFSQSDRVGGEMSGTTCIFGGGVQKPDLTAHAGLF